MRITGIPQAIDALHAQLAKLEAEAVAEVKKAAHVMMDNLFENTPVWSGETVRNYAVGINGMPSGGPRTPIGGTPGPTNTMVMGSEPLRRPNESAALQELDGALTFTKLVDLFFTNLISEEKWDLIDNGSAPSPGKARNPGGVSMLAEQSTRNALEHWK